MKRRMPHIPRVAATMLLLLLIAAWLRSYRSIEALHWTDGQRFLALLSSGGRINLTDSVWLNRTASPPGWRATSTPRTDPRRLPLWETDPDIYGRRRFLGFEWSDNLSPWPSKQTVILSFHLPPYRLIAAPYWGLAALAAVPLLRAMVGGYRRRVRRRHGLCPACAYDLRATPTACPECGWAEAAAACASGAR